MKTRLLILLLTLLLTACGAKPGDEQETSNQPVANSPVMSVFDSFFPKHIDVFGVSIRGTVATPDDKMLHAANVMAEYLDNNADGTPDNMLVIKALRENQATLIMTVDLDELESFDFNEIPDGELQDLNAAETLPGARSRGVFDATLEEVLHLITHAGYAYAYPEIFGEAPGTDLGNAMDIARGGRFIEIPDPYPDSAWYSYDDETCDYSCMATEYMYWSLTSLLGAQDFEGRLGQIDNEWRLDSADKLRDTDTAIHTLLTNPEYALPSRLPTGIYAGKAPQFSGATTETAFADIFESIDISKTKLATSNGVEFDFRVFAVPKAGSEIPLALEIGFPDGRQAILTQSYQKFPNAREHEAGLIKDPECNCKLWQYINIGLADLSDYGNGEYTFAFELNGQRHSLSIDFSDPETGAGLQVPAFPEILSPADGSKVDGEVQLSITPIDQEAFIFLGRQAREDETAQDFAEERTAVIAAGDSNSEVLQLSAGQWGGDVSAGTSHSGTTDGVLWQISVGAGTELDIQSGG